MHPGGGLPRSSTALSAATLIPNSTPTVTWGRHQDDFWVITQHSGQANYQIQRHAISNQEPGVVTHLLKHPFNSSRLWEEGGWAGTFCKGRSLAPSFAAWLSLYTSSVWSRPAATQ